MKKINFVLALLVLHSLAHAKTSQNVSIQLLRPTQSSVGFLEVARKKLKLDLKSKKELKHYLQKHSAPVVLGPKSTYYLVDHHHLALALQQKGIEELPIQVLADWSQKSEADFWKSMQEKKYVYLFNEKGAPLSPQELPQHIGDLKDDPYRSLAGSLRNCGGYQKVKIPFVEFQWANYLRDKISFDNSKKNLMQIMPKTLRIASSSAAKNLPGYIKNPPDLCDQNLLDQDGD